MLTYLGGFVALVLVYRFYKYFLRPGKNLKKYGKWAVVTGATDGIGKAMATEFAKKGLNVFLISRTQSKLDTVKTEIEGQCKGIEVDTLAIDYSDFGEVAQNKVQRALSALDIGVLVNNVGMSYDFPKYFAELTDAQVTQLLDLNVLSTTVMTRIVLPGMRANKRGAIVNISSASACFPAPLLAQYSAAKAYVINLSTSLAGELAGSGIDVQCQVPMYVTTKLAKIRRSSISVPSTTTYAKKAVAMIGYEALVSPYWVHALMLYVMDFLPSSLQASVVLAQHKPIRARGMKKAAAAAKSD